MEILRISLHDLHHWVDDLISEGKREVVGVVQKGDRYVYDVLKRADPLCLDYDETLLPPKKYLLPVKEALLSFVPHDPASYQEVRQETPRVIFGVHPGDLAAIALLDLAHREGHSDGHYLARRAQTAFVGLYPTVPYKYRFTASMIENEAYHVADLMLIDLGRSDFAIEVVTPRGLELARQSAAVPADTSDLQILEERKRAVKDETALSVSRKLLPRFLEGKEGDAVFDKRAERCFSCGSCVLVCPTCYCFDVQDEVELSLKEGRRVRNWDGCLLQGFAQVSGGHNFRKEPADRIRHRIFKKLKYIPERFHVASCVGCGRCAHACVAGIASPAEIINELYREGEKSESAVEMGGAPPPQKSIYLPEVATLTRTYPMTDRDKYFEFRMEGGPLRYQPGQFVELSIPGVGEAPFSIASSPGRNGNFEMVIRNTGGKVTSCLHRMEPGARVGLRGPFGSYFPMEELKGKDLLFVAGGCGLGPLRSAIQAALEQRADYGDITLLFGCTDPGQRIFKEDLLQWAGRKDVTFLETVDRCGSDWKGNVGVITTLFPKIAERVSPSRTKALVVGPPGMYPFVIRELHRLGFDDWDILVSLERRMKCGVGKCGHCQINHVYVCREGPVFVYKTIQGMVEAL